MNSEKVIDHCPRCNRRKSARHILCKFCDRLRAKEARRLARKSENRFRRNENALKKCTKLPAKNRMKSKIIDALMLGLPIPKPEPKKPKTIRYQSLASAITATNLSFLESFGDVSQQCDEVEK